MSSTGSIPRAAAASATVGLGGTGRSSTCMRSNSGAGLAAQRPPVGAPVGRGHEALHEVGILQCGRLRLEGAGPQRTPFREPVEGQLGAERRHGADAPAVGQPEHAPAGGRGGVDQREGPAAATPDGDGHAGAHGQVEEAGVTPGIVRRRRVLHELEDTGAERAQHTDQLGHLRPRGHPGGDGAIVGGPVVLGARGGEPVGPGPQGILQLGRHGFEIVRTGLLVEGALAHDERAQRRVPDVGGVVDALGLSLDRVEVPGERRPGPVDPRRHRHP